jgi:hypothetical protein
MNEFKKKKLPDRIRKFDWAFIIGSRNVEADMIAKIRRAGVKVIIWDADGLAGGRFRFWRAIGQRFDGYFTRLQRKIESRRFANRN